MRWIFTLLGLFFSTLFVAVSALMNWRFALTRSPVVVDAQTFGAMSVAADGMKALLPVMIFIGWKQKLHLGALVGLMFWVACTFYSLQSAYGFIALNRAVTTGAQQATVTAYKVLTADRDRYVAALSALPTHRPASAVKRAIEAHRTHYRWNSTKKCTDATASKSRSYCEAYHRLTGELAVAEEAKQIETKLDVVNDEIRSQPVGKFGRVIDPQVAVISAAFGMDNRRVKSWIITLMVVVSELGSGLGFFLVLTYFHAARQEHAQFKAVAVEEKRQLLIPAEPAVSVPARPNLSITAKMLDLDDYIRERLEPAEGECIQGAVLFEDFDHWCELFGAPHLKDMTNTKFGREMSKRITKVRKGGKAKYLDFRFNGGPLSAATAPQPPTDPRI